jgi:hypothetical protein
MTPEDAGSTAAPIEVGASRQEGTLRYFLAAEAVTKGELLLASQVTSIGRLQTSATAIMGWTVTISLALTAAIASALASQTNPPATAPNALSHLFWPAISSQVLVLIAALCCFVVLFPGRWHVPGVEPELILGLSYDTELEALESIASGYGQAASRNGRHLTRLEHLLRIAWSSFIGAPVAAMLIYYIAS